MNSCMGNGLKSLEQIKKFQKITKNTLKRLHQ